MTLRTRLASLAMLSMLAVGLLAVPSARADVLSLLPGSCGNEAESQPFAPWGDYNYYTLMPGGAFEPGSASWLLSGGAGVVPNNEPLVVDGSDDPDALSLPAGSSATSPYACTSIFQPTLRLFVRNTGSPSSKLIVQALYPGLLGGVQSTTLGELSASSSWSPSPAMTLLVDNLLATVSLDTTKIAFSFTPADNTGNWSIDEVWLDPYMRG